MPKKALNVRYLATAFYRWVMERKWRRLAEEESWEGTDRALTSYRFPLSQVASFKYMWLVLAAEYNNCPAVVRNLRRARQKWARLNRLLGGGGGVDYLTLGHIYLAVVQLSLKYGLEKWVLNPRMKRVLGGFHHRVARRMTWRQPRKGRDRGWFYPPLEDVMTEAGLQEVETYVSRRQNTVAQYISTRPITDLCLAENWRPGPRVAMRWWEQEGLDLDGVRTADREAEQTEGG